MDSTSKREFIESIRQNTFGIGTTNCNPLAKMLHESIVQLSAELYQKDIHFISELLQNAEDNVYGKGVSPSLELVLTGVDVARVGAKATLILFNNEVGFEHNHIEALCAVGLSTKMGKRDSGYIGEKGIGFKSVFLVTQTPYVISNGYRIRFTDEASSEGKTGYIVPEWVNVPTDADLRQVYGKQELPQTMIILPLRPDKIEPVRQQLKQISPETLLFLSKLRQLVVREDSRSSLCITRTDILPPTQGSDQSTKVATVKLALGSSSTHISEESTYHLLQQRLPVTHSAEQRKGVDNWDVTIAFPLRERINPGRFTGDIYAFLPSYLASGFPFVVNADFLLVSSRETLKFDSPWNIGILSCVPTVFRTAFNHFLTPNSKIESTGWGQLRAPAVAVREAYRYIPTKQPQNPQLRNVQQQILDDLKKEDCVLVDSTVSNITSDITSDSFCKPDMGRLIRQEFRSILVTANCEGKLNPVVRNRRWYVVDSQVQDRYSATLHHFLGVPHMTEAEYSSCLRKADWLLSLTEALYWEVVCFVLEYCRSPAYSQLKTVPILKYLKKDGSISLASIQDATNRNGMKIYLSPSEKGQWLSAWTAAFEPWVSVLFMPAETVRVLKDMKRKSHPTMCKLWEYLLSVVSNLSVKGYAGQLLSLMATASDRKFIILSTEFIYQCIQGKHVEKQDFPSSLRLVNRSGGITRIQRDTFNNSIRILLPAHGSLWPTLSLDSGWSDNFVVMSDVYVKFPSASSTSKLTKACVSHKTDPLLLESHRSYLTSVFGAMDIPHLLPPVDAQMPKQVSSNFTIGQAEVLLQWISVSKSPSLLTRLQQTAWLPTEEHGLRRPTSCFEKSSFTSFFQRCDVPCVHRSLAAFRATLEDLGVVTVVANGCGAVATYMLEMSSGTIQTRSDCDLSQAIRLYLYLQTFRWKCADVAQRVKIFVPADAEISSKAVWKESECCVIHNDDGFFDKSLTVLEDIYPQALLDFFHRVLNVPRQATVERYCQVWLKWRSDVHEISVDECTRVWKVVSEKWTNCDAQARKTFVANAWVPTVSSDGTVGTAIKLSSPSICFIPDDLCLQSLFATLPNVQFVWYPDNTEKMECALNKVYPDIGVKKLSECVQVEFTSSAAGVKIEDELRGVSPGSKILCTGLLRAILGFLARKKYGLSSSQRQDLLGSLSKGVVEISIPTPMTRSCTISCLSPPVRATQDNVMALWSRTEPGKFYRVDNDNPKLCNSLARRDFRTQVATTISHGLLSEHPLIAEDLTEFLIGLVLSDFEPAHVNYELARKKAKLYEEDELFLSSL